MNVLEKIWEEIKNNAELGDVDFGSIRVEKVEEILRSHMNEVTKCNECSRRKWYQKGYEDGKNDGWIPVSEKLPEESDYYTAYICNDEVCDYDIRKTWFAHADDYDMDKSEWRELYDFERVIAWKPLPKPYKEG